MEDIDELNKMIGAKLWEHRVELGITRSEIAAKVGVSHQQFEKYEKGLNRLSVGTFATIMKYFDLSPEVFFKDIKVRSYTAPQRRMCMELSRNFLNIKEPKHRKLLMLTSRLLREDDDNSAPIQE